MKRPTRVLPPTSVFVPFDDNTLLGITDIKKTAPQGAVFFRARPGFLLTVRQKRAAAASLAEARANAG